MSRIPVSFLVFVLFVAGCDCGAEEGAAGTTTTTALPQSADDYARRLASLCDEGSDRHCWYLGALYSLGGAGLPADAARAAALFERTCRDGSVYGCREAGASKHASGDAAGATERWERGCRGLRVRSCAELMKRLPRQDTPFAESTVLGCRAGIDHFCHAAGRAIADIEPAPEGQPTEESLLPPGVEQMIVREAMRCDRRTGTMCTALAERYLAEPPPPGMTRDPEHARRLAERACNDLNVNGCAVLGRLAMQTEPPDREAAEQLLLRSCDGGSARGCRSVLELLEPRDSEEELRRRDIRLELCLTFEEPQECDPVRDLVGPDYGAAEPRPAAAP